MPPKKKSNIPNQEGTTTDAPQQKQQTPPEPKK